MTDNSVPPPNHHDTLIHTLQEHQIELQIQNEELKKAHRDLESSRDRYIDLYDYAPVGYFTLTKNTLITEVNLTGATMLGVVRQKLIQTRFRKFIVPGDQDRWDRYLLNILMSEGKESCELQLIQKDEIEFSARIEAFRVQNADGSFQVRISISDITDRKKAEEEIKKSETRYRRLFESAQDGILILNRETGEIIDSNPFIETLIGYSKEELIGKQLWNIGVIKDQIASKAAFQELQIKNYIRYENLPLETKGGKRIEVEFVSNVYPIDPFTSVIQCNIRDITDRRHAEEALNEASQKLRLLTSLTRHDIINQINALQLLLSMAIDTPGSDSVKNYLSRAQETGKQIENTIGFTVEYEDFGIVSSGWLHIHSIIESSKTEVSLGEIAIFNQIPDDIEIYADPIIRKVFITLMENAVRHGGELTKICFSISEFDGIMIIICADDGIGIRSTEKEYIFDHGFGTHTGIGLFLSREILSITGMTIRERGIPGEGARFEIVVPKGKFRRHLL